MDDEGRSEGHDLRWTIAGILFRLPLDHSLLHVGVRPGALAQRRTSFDHFGLGALWLRMVGQAVDRAGLVAGDLPSLFLSIAAASTEGPLSTHNGRYTGTDRFTHRSAVRLMMISSCGKQRL